MTKRKDMAPETHNDEQEDASSQAQTVAQQARYERPRSALDSKKSENSSDIDGDSTPDLVDNMRDMLNSGRIDMGAYRGEPNYDDNEGKYGEDAKPDPDLPSDGK